MVYTLGPQGRHGQPGVFGMDETTAVQRFPDLSIDWSFMATL